VDSNAETKRGSPQIRWHTYLDPKREDVEKARQPHSGGELATAVSEH
jgi:hypothetical protein